MTDDPQDVKSLFDEILDANGLVPRCQMRTVLDKLPDGDKETLTNLLKDESVTGSAIARVLRGRGYQITEGSLRRHRRGECSCKEIG